jgi:hypothetical protein
VTFDRLFGAAQRATLWMPRNQGKAYLRPVARVMRFFRHHIGGDAVAVTQTPDGLDIAAG